VPCGFCGVAVESRQLLTHKESLPLPSTRPHRFRKLPRTDRFRPPSRRLTCRCF
jgi:hypothetical protein